MEFSGRAVFNGYNVKLYDKNGSMIYETQAISGRPGIQYPANTGIKRTGSLPEGAYSIDTNAITYRSILSPLWYFSGTAGSAWGNARAKLEPEPGTNTLTRDNFFLHGGKEPGSAGCIDVLDNDVKILNIIKSMGGKVKVEVNYSEYNAKEPHPLLRDLSKHCFVAGTKILAIGTDEILIEKIQEGTVIAAFESNLSRNNNLQYKKVSKIFKNITREIVDIRGIFCTAGHVFLTGDTITNGQSHFDTIASILRKDGTLVEQDATIIRARTGAKLGQADDAFVSIVYRDPPLADQPGQERRALVRAGITLPPVIIKDALAPAQTLAQHLADHGITPLADGRLRTPDGTIHDACNWPEGTTPFDTHEARNWIVQSDGVPYCPPWIRDLVAEDETEGLRVVGALSA